MPSKQSCRQNIPVINLICAVSTKRCVKKALCTRTSLESSALIHVGISFEMMSIEKNRSILDLKFSVQVMISVRLQRSVMPMTFFRKI